MRTPLVKKTLSLLAAGVATVAVLAGATIASATADAPAQGEVAEQAYSIDNLRMGGNRWT